MHGELSFVIFMRSFCRVAGKVASCGKNICPELDLRERRGELPNTLQEFERLLGDTKTKKHI